MTTTETDDLVPEGRARQRALVYATQGAAVAARSAVVVGSRVVVWALFGAVSSAVVTGVLYATGLYDHPNELWTKLRWLVLLMLPVAGGVLFGYAGLWRGLGRTALLVAVESGALAYVLGRVLGRVVATLKRSERVEGALQSADGTLRDLPLARVEGAIRGAVGDENGEEASGGRIARWVRGMVCLRVQVILLAVVRAESRADGSGGGVDLEKARALAFERADDIFTGLVEDLVKRKTMLVALVLLVVLALPPLALAVARAS